MGKPKYDPSKSFGEEWAEETITGRAAKAAAQMIGIDPDEQRPNRALKRNRETGTGRFRPSKY